MTERQTVMAQCAAGSEPAPAGHRPGHGGQLPPLGRPEAQPARAPWPAAACGAAPCLEGALDDALPVG
jgi:hypothetical protein